MKAQHLLIKFVILFTLPHIGHAKSAETKMDVIQGEFSGPVNLKIWKHWQQSWNVEYQSPDSWTFQLIRGFTSDGQALVKVHFKTSATGLTATIQSELAVRSGEWDMSKKIGTALTASGQSTQPGITDFEFVGADEFLDISEKQFVNSIRITITKTTGTLFDQTLLPMYVRGKQGVYWNNAIDSYRAHAGGGSIQVATASAAERPQFELWNGISVQPTLNFIERNTLSAGAIIGLHRHEENQEMYLMESGSAMMRMGVAPVSSEVYKTRRQWDGSSSTMTDTDEFQARGGWIESRVLTAGQYSVIVPDPKSKNSVYFHGIEAVTPTLFWTMGTKN
jgi:hypothetical protein